jgi:hypothetical protein
VGKKDLIGRMYHRWGTDHCRGRKISLGERIIVMGKDHYGGKDHYEGKDHYGGNDHFGGKDHYRGNNHCGREGSHWGKGSLWGEGDHLGGQGSFVEGRTGMMPGLGRGH